MNISTSTLLNILAPKLSNDIKNKIDNLTKNGKVDIQTALKDKTIQTVLSDLFKDVITGVKTKNATQELLNNSKSLFDLKTTQNDLKNILSSIKDEPKLNKQTTIIKEFLINIKNIDDKILKNNFSNSGIFLESKLNTSQTISPKNIFEHLFLNLKSFDTVKTALNSLQTQVQDNEIKQDIQKIITQIKTAEITLKDDTLKPLVKTIQSDIKNLETKLVTNNILQTLSSIEIKNSSSITNDIKTILLQVQESLEISQNSEQQKELKLIIEKLLTQVEFYQLYSYTANSNISYLPFLWDSVEDGELKFNQKNKDEFSCQINLVLKDFGELKTLLQLDNKNNILINIAVEDINLKDKIQQNIHILRKAINSIGLKIQGLNIFDTIQEENKTYEQKAYSSNNHIDLGIDIKV